MANVILGIWLFASAFIWSHSIPQFSNCVLTGGAMASFAVIAMWAPQARFLNTAGSIWLLISAFLLPAATVATVVNSVIVACAMFFASLAGNPVRTSAGAH